MSAAIQIQILAEDDNDIEDRNETNSLSIPILKRRKRIACVYDDPFAKEIPIHKESIINTK